MNTQKMNDELSLFWDEVKLKCDYYQKELNNLTYYVFQTPVSFNPDLMIIGYNPGGRFFGEGFLKREINWYTNWQQNNVKEENHSFNRTLCAVFGYQISDKLTNLIENAVGTNVFYFNTESEDTLNKLKIEKPEMVKEMLSFCQEKTRKLVDDIIKPKQILTIHNKTFHSIKNRRIEILSKNPKIYKSFRNNIPVYYIPNPSRRLINQFYSTDEKIKSYRLFLEKLLFVTEI